MPIRPFQEKDIPAVHAMATQLWPDADSKDLEEDMHAVLKRANEKIFVTETAESKVVAFVHVSLRQDYVEGSDSSPVGYVEAIFVEENHRKKGLARALVEKGESWAREKGCTEMGSDTWLWNTASQAFHKQLGYRETERVVHFIKKISPK